MQADGRLRMQPDWFEVVEAMIQAIISESDSGDNGALAKDIIYESTGSALLPKH